MLIVHLWRLERAQKTYRYSRQRPLLSLKRAAKSRSGHYAGNKSFANELAPQWNGKLETADVKKRILVYALCV